VPAVRDAGAVPRRRHRHQLVARDLVVPGLPAGPFPSLAERPPRPGLRRGVNEESFGSRGRRLRGEAGYAAGPAPVRATRA
jgi:hypothetical protein